MRNVDTSSLSAAPPSSPSWPSAGGSSAAAGAATSAASSAPAPSRPCGSAEGEEPAPLWLTGSVPEPVVEPPVLWHEPPASRDRGERPPCSCRQRSRSSSPSLQLWRAASKYRASTSSAVSPMTWAALLARGASEPVRARADRRPALASRSSLPSAWAQGRLRGSARIASMASCGPRASPHLGGPHSTPGSPRAASSPRAPSPGARHSARGGDCCGSASEGASVELMS
mmetsp:Transcript_60323/g.166991  ORF Transcript_60323/g.166991 Transcript_60323/m.166991 type:complete len:228 (-) Transcript_60323:33-716(-)